VLYEREFELMQEKYKKYLETTVAKQFFDSSKTKVFFDGLSEPLQIISKQQLIRRYTKELKMSQIKSLKSSIYSKNDEEYEKERTLFS
jgi:hypothetical protein